MPRELGLDPRPASRPARPPAPPWPRRRARGGSGWLPPVRPRACRRRGRAAASPSSCSRPRGRRRGCRRRSARSGASAGVGLFTARGEVAGGARLGQVALLRGVRHQQVVSAPARPPARSPPRRGRSAAPAARRPRRRPSNGRAPSPCRCRAAAARRRAPCGRRRARGCRWRPAGRRQLAALDLAERRDRADDVLVHRVVVVHVELHHRDDAAELRDEGAEHADLVHQPQRPLGVVVPEQQLEEDAVRLGVGAHPSSISARFAADRAARRGGSGYRWRAPPGTAAGC